MRNPIFIALTALAFIGACAGQSESKTASSLATTTSPSTTWTTGDFQNLVSYCQDLGNPPETCPRQVQLLKEAICSVEGAYLLLAETDMLLTPNSDRTQSEFDDDLASFNALWDEHCEAPSALTDINP